MPLGLHADCLTRLREVVSAAIPRFEVQQGAFVTTDAMLHLREADAALPGSGPIHDRLLDYVGETPASTFIYQRLNREVLAEAGYRDTNAPAMQPLQGIPRFADAAAIAGRIIDEFESLPWDYTLSFPMPKAFSAVFATEPKTIALSDRFSIVAPDAAFEGAFPVPDPDYSGGLLFPFTGYSPSGAWEAGSAYLQLRATGFIGPHGATSPLDAAETVVREFAGLGTALRLFAPERSRERNFRQPHFVVHRMDGTGWAFDCEPAWATDQSRTFAELELDDVFGHVTNEMRPDWVLDVLGRIKHVLADEHSRRLRRGAQWLFDSFCEPDLPVAFVRAAVVMEVFLGEKAASDAVGLSELLASRLAYLVGRSQTEREQLARDFKAIYDVRSRIVHLGQSTLTTPEIGQLIELRNMCRRVIHREVELLEREAERARAEDS